MEHVVYCDSKNNEVDKIINKEKTMLIRANQSRRIPHSRVFKGEKLYFTNKNSNVINYEAEVKEVYNYNKLFNHEIDKIINNYNEKLCLDDKEKEKNHKKCLCLVEFENLKKCDEIKINPQASLVDWIILNDIEDIKQKN